MSAAKHTPGPWRVLPGESDKDYLRVRGTRLGQRYKVANVVGVTSIPSRKEMDDAETAANARLIAEAPGLLVALQLLLIAYREAVKLYDPNTDDAFTVTARSAIAKATEGES